MLNPAQIAQLNQLGVEVSKTLEPDVNAIFTDQFFIETNIEQLPSLKYLQVATSGLDQIKLNHPKLANTVVSGSRGVFNKPMAEYVLGHVLSIYHNHRFFAQTQKDQQWRPSRHSEELNGKELRSLAREYLSNLTSLEILYNSRQSSLFDLMAPELKKSILEIEKEAKDMVIKL
jgi:hypothetical protein